MSLPRVVLADVVADGVVAEGAGAAELIEQVARAVIVVGVVVLDKRVGDAAVEVKPAAVQAPRAALIGVRLVVLKGDVIRIPGPDSDRPATGVVAVLPVIPRERAFDHSAVDVAEDDAGAGISPDVGQPAVVVGAAPPDVRVGVGVLGGAGVELAVEVDADVAVVVRRGIRHADVVETGFAVVPLEADAGPLEMGDVQVVDADVIQLCV